MILLAVLVFVALLLPLVTLVLTSINTESVSTAETIKGAKAELAAEKAINDAVSLVVQEKEYPSYYTSVAQSADAEIIGQPQFLVAGGAFDRAIIVRDAESGQRRDAMIDSTGASTGASEDDMWGTGDDYWVGPRRDRSYIPGDYDASSTFYRYDFRFKEMHGPTYIGQSWAFSTANRDFAYSQFNDQPVWLFNQFAAIDPRESTQVAGVPSGYNVNDPFESTDNAEVSGPGFYTGAPDPAGRDLADAGIEEFLYSAKVNLYESIYSDLDRGPIPTSLLKSYANVTDEAGRLNLNIFCKKVRVYMPESMETDYDFDGYSTNDFNMNTVVDEEGWKWMDNPLFPDRYTTRAYDYDFTAGASNNAILSQINDEAIAGQPIDFGIYDPANPTAPFAEPTGTPDDPLAELGETVQHLYMGDEDNDGVPESVEAMRKSLRMLTSIPGIDPRMAAAILTYLNPPQDILGSAGSIDGDANRDYNPVLDWWYPTLREDYNTLTTEPVIAPETGEPRLDACNITPPLLCQDIEIVSGVVDERRWALEWNDNDDLPLPQPHPLNNLEDLLNIPGMTQVKFNRLKDYITIFSYDTNLIANYIQDVGQNVELEQAYTPGDREYTGSVLRSFTADDNDDLTDMRFNLDEFVYSYDQRDVAAQAERMFAFAKAHLPRPLFDKIHLPVVDRMGRADEIDSYRQNDDPLYNLSQGGLYVPHRDGDEHPYNVGASGHQFEHAGMEGAGYPALNPEFTLDSCLAIVTYRNGAATQFGDDYSTNPQAGAYNTAMARLPFGPLLGFVRRLNGPIAFFLDTMQDQLMVNPNAGFNVNPVGRAHGSGLLTYASLLNPGEFDSVADTLNVPLYGFRNLAIDVMCDPPSTYRADVRQPAANTVQAFDPVEQSPVNYYASLSDIWDVGDFLALAGDDGQLGTADDSAASIGGDGVPGTSDDPELYRVYFTIASQPDTANLANINPDLWQAEIPITSSQLRAINAGSEEGKTKITVVAYDNLNNINVLGPEMLSDAAWIATYGPASTYAGYGDLYYDFSWQDCPYPEDAGPYGVGLDPNGRPDEAGYWEGGIRPAFDDAYAFDMYGDPFLTARAEVVKLWGDSDPAVAAPENQLRADDTTRCYIQNNEDAVVPFRVDILPVRVSGDSYELRSAVGGETTTNGSYLLYDWELNGDRTAADQQSFDGTWPEHQPGQSFDPRIIRVSPAADTVSLRVYDLRVFEDGTLNLPIQSEYPDLSGFLPQPYSGGEVNLDPLNTGGSGWPGLPAPVNGDAGYWEDAAAVQRVLTSPEILPEVAITTPSLYANDTQLQFLASAVGGSLPYTMTLRVCNDLGALVTTSNFDESIVWPAGGGGTAADWLAYSNSNPLLPAPRLGYAGQAGSQLGASIAASQMVTSNDVEEIINLDLSSPLGAGAYWVELEVTDGTQTEWAYTAFAVGTESSPSGSTGRAPEMVTSINLRPLDNAEGSTRLGFIANSSTDGGTGGYSYYWEVTRPVYDNDGVVTSYSIVDAQAPFVGADAVELVGTSAAIKAGYTGRPMVSNEANPSFEFHTGDFFTPGSTSPTNPDGTPDAWGVYFVHCYVFDQAGANPNTADALVAHDVAMIRLDDTGGVDIGEPGFESNLVRTPMAVLHAITPGNAAAQLDPTEVNASGPGAITLSAIDPPHAAVGDVIAVYGNGFNTGSASANTVRFGGGTTTTGIRVENLGGGDGVLYVKVPQGATTGYVAVTSAGTTSDGMFFMTNFPVTFDLIGNLAANDANYLKFELDFQGDGHIDYTYSTMANPQHPGYIDGGEQDLSYDYGRDGTGNYMATLYVTDLISGRVQKDQQLIMIRDPEVFDNVTITLTSGVADELRSDGVLIDYDRDFDSNWAAYAVEVVQNPGPAEVVGAVTGYDAGTGGLITSLANWAIGDAYIVRRTLDVEGTGDMIVNIWPELDQRFDTFTPDREEYAGDPDAGLSFYSAAGGGFYSTADYSYKWTIDDNNMSGTSVVTTGEVTAPDPVELDPLSGTYTGYNGRHRVVIDADARFVSDGVQAGDIFFNATDNDSFAEIQTVVSETQLLLAAPGLGGGAAPRRLRSGAADQVLAGGVAPAGGGAWTSTWDWTIRDNDYNFFGLHTGGSQGGFVGDPAGVGAGTAAGDGSSFFTPTTPVNDQRLKQWLNATEHTRWEIVSTPQTGATDQLVVSRLPSPGHADDQGLPAAVTLAGIRGPADGVRQFGIQGTTNNKIDLGGTPRRMRIRANVNWNTYDGVFDPGSGIGAYVYSVFYDSLWRIVNVDTSAGGTLTQAPNPPNWLEVEFVSGTTDDWNNTGTAAQRQNYIVLPSQWVPGDTWNSTIAKRQLRVGDQYRILRDRDNTGVGNVDVKARADADYATLNAVIDYDIDLTYPFDLAAGTLSTIQINWNGTNIAGAEPPIPVDSTTLGDGGTTGFEQESLHFSHQFGVAGKTNAWFWLSYTDSNGTHQVGPYQLPAVMIGGDDYDVWPNWNGAVLRVNSWESDAGHRVSCEVSYDVAAGGTPYGASRRFAASDQLYIPGGMSGSADALTSYVSYSRPFVTSNAVSVSRLRHQAVHGAGGASLDWIADANADSRWNSLSESPLAANPVNYFEFVFGTPMNQMNVTGLTYPGNGASFPRAVPGVGREGTLGGFTYYIADRGVYTGMGFNTEALADIDDRGFSFDSQPIFVGERLSGSDDNISRISLGADLYVSPLATTNSQQVALRSYVTGGNGNPGNYIYLWTVTRYGGGGSYTWTSNQQNPLFYPIEEDTTGDGSGYYRVFLTVTAPSGMVRTAFTEFQVITPSPLVNVMANPPSTTTGADVELQIFQEGYAYDTPGGVLVRIDYGTTAPPFSGVQGVDWDTTTVTESGIVTFDTSFLEAGDYTITVDMPGGAGADAQTVVVVADRIPLKASLLASPPSGVAPFATWIDFSIAGGETFSDGSYQVSLQLVNTSTGDTQQVSSELANTFGANGVKDSLDSGVYDDEPVYFVVPEAGTYVLFLYVLDNSGNMAMTYTSLFASGYTAPVEYGQPGPIVVADKEGRPMHAVRIWTDPFLSRGGGSTSEYYGNTQDDLRGGRLLEADLQVLGDVFQTDVNPNWRSFGNYGSTDPYNQPRYFADYTLSAQEPGEVHDYYDTFTEGRVNINTASVETLTALFRNIRRIRGYDFFGKDANVPTVDDDGDGINDVLYMHDPSEDIYLTQAEARALAEAVVDYRNAYYDLYKPDTTPANTEFGYVKAAGSAGNGLENFRVDHLPVIGPYDGVNPYDKTLGTDRLVDRARALMDADDGEMHNSYDHLAASYYNFSANQYMFYSPTDIAFVRPQGQFAFDIDGDGVPNAIDTNGDLIPDTTYFAEPPSNYAKYLNDVVSNNYWEDNRYDGAGYDLWQDTGLMPGADYYSRWSFDARNYFYHGGTPTVLLTLGSGTNPIAVDTANSQVPAASDGRNKLSIIQSNAETAYAYIDNPPFRSLFDLYKVINASQVPDTFSLDGSGPDSFLNIYDGTSNTIEGSTILNHTEIWRNAQVFSGPSLFRYSCQWYQEAGEFIPVTNYLDDIAPYLTCRSYVFRVEAVGAVTASGGSAGAVLDTARISRDRTKEAIVDVGPLWTRTGAQALSLSAASSGLRMRGRQDAYNILYYRDSAE